jgi:trans-aconitate 2-methyltransferase
MAHEFDGSKYREGSTHQKEWGTRLIEELSLLGHERIPDLGCGDGALTARIAELVPQGHVVGVNRCHPCSRRSRVRAGVGFKNLPLFEGL